MTIDRSPRISIIVSVLNGAKGIARCINSVAEQRYPNVELIIMDGGSNDATAEILKAHDRHITYWESVRDRGICHAWNKALGHSTGEWIYFLGADDYLWSDDVLAHMAPHLVSADSPARVVYGRVAKVNTDGRVLEVVGRPWLEIRQRFLQEMVLAHQGVFHHRDLFRNGGFDEAYLLVGDYELLLRELKTGPAVFIDDVIVAGFQLGGLSNRPAGVIKCLQEIARARQKNDVRTLPLRWGWIYSKAWVHLGLSWIVGDERCGRLVDVYRRCSGRPPIWS